MTDLQIVIILIANNLFFQTRSHTKKWIFREKETNKRLVKDCDSTCTSHTPPTTYLKYAFYHYLSAVLYIAVKQQTAQLC